MFKKIVVTIFCGLSLFAGELKVGDAIEPFSLPDQFDTVHEVNSNDYERIVVAFEKDVAVMMNDWLKEKPADFLKNNKTLFISDIHEMPSFVTKLFALPKMREYKYPLLLMYEENKVFPEQEESLSVLRIHNGKIVAIYYIKNEENNAAKIAQIFN